MSTEEARKALSAKLCELRTGLNMTPEDVQKATDDIVSAEYLLALENFQVKFPSPYILFYLAGVYIYPYKKLMELAGHVRPNPLRGRIIAKERIQ